MKVQTPRFGELDVADEEMVHFPEGLPGFTGKRYVLFHQPSSPVIEWLQSVDEPDVALMTVDPQAMLLDYHPQPAVEDIQALHPEDGLDALAVRIILRNADVPNRLRLNLFAPLLFNVPRRLGMQVPLVGSGYPVAALWPPAPDDEPASEPGAADADPESDGDPPA
jgi:flagellar assembly factor FliW